MPVIRERADTVIWLDPPRRTVMRRLIWRTIRRAAGRAELWNGNRERWRNLLTWDQQESVISWVWHHYPSTGSVTLPQPATPPTATSCSRGSPPALIWTGSLNPSASRTVQPRPQTRHGLYARPAANECVRDKSAMHKIRPGGPASRGRNGICQAANNAKGS
jgi:hypothetical protein